MTVDRHLSREKMGHRRSSSFLRSQNSCLCSFLAKKKGFYGRKLALSNGFILFYISIVVSVVMNRKHYFPINFSYEHTNGGDYVKNSVL